MTLDVQWLTMAVMLLSGIGMGVVFDGYRVVSVELKFPRWWLPVLDIMYWMAAAVIVFRVLYASNYGEVRAYVFLGLAAGVIAYYYLFSKFIIKVVKWCIQAIRTVIAFIIKLLDFIIVKPVKLLFKLLQLLFGFGSVLTIFLFNIVLQLLRPIWKLLLWIMRPVFRPIWKWLAPHLSKLRIGERTTGLRTKCSELWNKWSRWFRR